METYIVLKQGSYFIYSSEFIRGVEIRDSTNKIKQIINLKNSLKKAVNLDINDKILYPSNFIGLINIYIDEKGSGSGGGSVDSVNGQTGEVILKSADIGMTTNLGFPNVDSTIVGLSTILQTTMKLNSGTDAWVATNKRISLVAEPTDNSDASNKKYVDDSISNIPPVDLSGVYLLNGSKTMDISYIPILDTDLITLKYFNDNSGGGSSGVVTSVNELTGDVVLDGNNIKYDTDTTLNDKIDSIVVPDLSTYTQVGNTYNVGTGSNFPVGLHFTDGEGGDVVINASNILCNSYNDSSESSSLKLTSRTIQDSIETSSLDENGIILKKDLNRVEITNPTTDQQIATKKYVDDLVATLQTLITNIQSNYVYYDSTTGKIVRNDGSSL
jgi:hypothetical protein